MNFKKHHAFLILFVGGHLLSSCGGSIPSPDPEAPNTVTLRGQVLDAASGEVIVRAKINIGSRSAVTDNNGYYEISDFPSSSGVSVSRDYQATINLNEVISPIDMTNSESMPRYPEIKFSKPINIDESITPVNHNFLIGKLSANIRGVVGDDNRFPVGNVVIELWDNSSSIAATTSRVTTSDPETGQYEFLNVEAGIEYKLIGESNDRLLQGELIIAGISDSQSIQLDLNSSSVLLLNTTDSYSPRIIKVSPENNSDVAPGNVNIVFTFNEPIYQDSYSIPNPLLTTNNIYYDINVSYGGQKAAGNLAHDLYWNLTFDELTVAIPFTGVSSKNTIDLSLLSPKEEDSIRTLGKLKDNAGNGLENSPVLSEGQLLSFTTSGGVVAEAPVLYSINAASLDSDATSVILDWQPVLGATKGYNIYRSTRNSLDTGVVEPLVFLSGPISESKFEDTFDEYGFGLILNSEIAQHYVYYITSVNSDLIESAPSNEITIRDVIVPSIVGTSGQCVPPGGNSLTVLSPVTITENGQVQITFSEPLDVIMAENVANYTANNLTSVKLISPTEIVLDFSTPIICANTETVLIGETVTDVAGNAISGTEGERMITFSP